MGRLYTIDHNQLSISTIKSLNVSRLTLKIITRGTYPFASGNMAVAEGVKTDLVELTGLPDKKIKVIYNPAAQGIGSKRKSSNKDYYQELSKVINNSDIDKVFIKGKKTIFTYKQLNKNKRGNILQNNEDIDISLREMISNNDHLMIKGSNATGLNDFSKKMIKGI